MVNKLRVVGVGDSIDEYSTSSPALYWTNVYIMALLSTNAQFIIPTSQCLLSPCADRHSGDISFTVYLSV